MMIFYIAFRNLAMQRKRYLMIGTAVMVGFALITAISGAAYGAMETVKAKAARYFAGHVSVTGYTGKWPQLDDPDAVEAGLRASGIPFRTIARRTVYYNTDARLLFGGETVRQRRLVGIEFEEEREELANLTFAEGSVEAMLGKEGRHGILISDFAAGIMGARIGDDVNLSLTTDTGQYTTAAMVVRGIFSETSLFGFVAYIRNDDLNRLLQRAPGSATDIAVYAKSGVNPEWMSVRVHDILAQGFTVFPYLGTKSALTAALADGYEGNRLAVLSLDAHLAQIKSILDAFLAVTYFVLAVFVIIVMVGILNTYRVIVYERTREIGTMRALGMSRLKVSAIFLVEALGLATIASLLGLALGAGFLGILGLVDFSRFSAAGIMTDGGKLRFYIDPVLIALNLVIMIGGVIVAALGPARKASAVRPVEAMRSES